MEQEVIVDIHKLFVFIYLECLPAYHIWWAYAGKWKWDELYKNMIIYTYSHATFFKPLVDKLVLNWSHLSHEIDDITTTTIKLLAHA